MTRIYVSRRNLLTLLSKLDRAEAGEQTKCSLILPCGTMIIAREDKDHYAGREPGAVHPKDEP